MGAGIPDRACGAAPPLRFPACPRTHKPAEAASTFKGVTTDFSRLAEEGVVTVYVSEKRAQKITDVIDGVLDGTQILVPAPAQRLAGKLQFTLSWTFGRLGRPAMQPIQRRAADERSPPPRACTPALRRALIYLKSVPAAKPPIEIRLDVPARPPVLVWSDAVWEPKKADPAVGGFVVIVPGDTEDAPERIWYSYAPTPNRTLLSFVPRKRQYIGQLELLWAAVPYRTLPEVFAGRTVLHFIDNTSACTALVKGYSKAIDGGRIVNAFHAFNAGICADVWFEYVRSEANVADYPSRLALAKMLDAIRAAVPGNEPSFVESMIPDVSGRRGATRQERS